MDVLLAEDQARLHKTDPDGNKLWDKTFGGEEGDYGESPKENSNGELILLGVTQSFGIRPLEPETLDVPLEVEILTHVVAPGDVLI